MVEDIVTLRSLNARLEEEKQNLMNSATRKQTIIYKQEQQLHNQNLTIENLKNEKEHLELQIKQITLQHRKQIKNILMSAKSTERRLQSSLLDVSEKATKRIEELEIENAELKDKLTKAKEIIGEFVEWANWEGANCPKFQDIQSKAEKFLKEV